MITERPTERQLEEWKALWLKYKDRIRPNRKTGAQLLRYLQNKYVLTEIHDKNAADTVVYHVTMNRPNAEKLPHGAKPEPRMFYVENEGAGEALYREENRAELWGDIKIFVGIDAVTGCFTVEGSTMLWDELCAFIGLDEFDLKNYVCVSQYIYARRRLGENEDGLVLDMSESKE